MKLINKNLIIMLLGLMLAPYALASDFRDANISGFEDESMAEEVIIDDDEPIDIQNSSKAVKPHQYTIDEDEYYTKRPSMGNYETYNVVKDNNEKLYGVVGKSQVLTFDKSITRASITDNKIADLVVLSSTQVLLNGKKPGATSVVFWGDNDRPMFYNLVIQQNADDFLQAVEHVAPNENVSVIFNEDGAVLSGYLSSTAIKNKIAQLAKAYKINLTDVTESPSKQVLLEVKVTEASKNFSRNIGLNLVAGKNLDLSGFQAGDWTVPSGFRGKAHVFQSGNGFTFGYFKGGKYGIDFEASEAKGDIKILAEPKLLAVDGEAGEFSVGNQVPVPSEMGQYGNVSYDYKDTGVILKFTPTIMEGSGRVRLELNPEVSEVDDSVSVASLGNTGTTVYGFKTRKIKTTVELNSGETLIIGGLLQNSSSRSRSQVPILGNIPGLGSLFSITKDEKRDTDLIIFITPRIIDNSISKETL